ncbi:MAG: hypothetical protein WA824_10080 [Candidatus Sulfotelmatobacter sp.]
MAIDASGNLYGTEDGPNTWPGAETAFELSPVAGGRWLEKLLCNLLEINVEEPSGLVLDPAGNLYGTSRYGGRFGVENGTLFEISPYAAK